MKIFDSYNAEVKPIVSILTNLMEECPSVKLSIVIFPDLDSALYFPPDSKLDVNLSIETARSILGQVLESLDGFSFGKLNHVLLKTDRDTSLLICAFSDEVNYFFWIVNDAPEETMSIVSKILNRYI